MRIASERRARTRQRVRCRLAQSDSLEPSGIPLLSSVLPHLHREWAHPFHICPGTALGPATSAPGLRAPATSAPGTGPTPATSAPGTALAPVSSILKRSVRTPQHHDGAKPNGAKPNGAKPNGAKPNGAKPNGAPAAAQAGR
jgi:hypothetical protein